MLRLVAPILSFVAALYGLSQVPADARRVDLAVRDDFTGYSFIWRDSPCEAGGYGHGIPLFGMTCEGDPWGE